MKQTFAPVFLVSLLFLSLSHYLDLDNHLLLQPFVILTFLLAVACYALKKFRSGYVLIALALGLLLTAQFLKEKADYDRCKEFPVPQGQYITIEGKLIAFPEIKSDHSIIFIRTASLEFHREKHFIPLNLRVKVMGNLEGFYRGDTVSLDASVYQTHWSMNFTSNFLENYLLVRKSHFNGYCKSPRLVALIQRTSLFWRLVGEWRNKIRDAIDRSSLDQRGVFLQAILLGERGKLTPHQEDQLLAAGVFHLLAISGAHIGIIALLCLGLLKQVKVSSRKRYMITAVVLLIFLVLSGFKISAERAVLMAILIFIARVLGLDVDIFNIISFCGVLLLARNPGEFLDAGFILTFSLTAAIVMGRDLFLPMLQRLALFKKAPPFIGEILSANFSAALLALPLSLFYFHRYSFAGFISGLLLVPLTGLLIGLGILLMPLVLISSSLANLLLIIIDLPLRIFFAVTAFFANTVDLSIFRASPSFTWVLVIFILFYWLSTAEKKSLKIALAAAMTLLLLFISVNLFFYAPKNLEVFFLDVGQGDSQVVVFPGGDALLIDGGGSYFSDFQVGRNIVLPFILQKKIKIKWVAVSHYHPDHAYGVAEIIRIIKPEELWLSSEAPGEPGYQKLVRVIPSSTRVKKPVAPFLKKIGACRVEFLYPDHFIRENRSRNNHSQVIRVSDASHSFLFTADIEKEVEAYLRENSCPLLETTVLKVPHHGSASSSTPGFLDCVKPRWAIFSYALNNRFHFPHRGVLKSYQRRGVRYLSTARSGGIRFVSLPGELKIETSR